MRLSLWLVLIFAFSVGMCCALAVRTLYFEAAPQSHQSPVPTTKILVAKQTIPSGVDINADSVVFQEVAVSEVPSGSLSSFAQVFRRQPAYSIPAGCPICEDLLAPPAETEIEQTFLPAGSQFVTLDIIHVRKGNKVFLPHEAMTDEPLSKALTVDQRIDVRVVPRNEVQGVLAEKKKEVLRAFTAANWRSDGELLLENVPIRQVQRSLSGQTASEKVLLVLDKAEADRLSAAAKKGQIRILLNEEPAKTEPQPKAVASVSEHHVSLDTVEPPTQEAPSVYLPAETLPVDVPLVSELSASTVVPSIAATEAMPEPSVILADVPQESAKQPASEKTTLEKTVPAPKTPDIFSAGLPPAPVPDLASPDPATLPDAKLSNANLTDAKLIEDEVQTPQPMIADTAADKPAASFVQEVIVKEKIRNDSSILAFGTPSIRVISEHSVPAPLDRTALPASDEAASEEVHAEPTAASEQSPTALALSADPPAIHPAVHTSTLSTASLASEPLSLKAAEEFPRLSQSVSFPSSHTVLAGRSEAGETLLPSETAAPLLNESSAHVPSVKSIVTPSIPNTAVPNIEYEKVPEYSPFERRFSTMPSSGPSEKTTNVLSAPERLQPSAEEESKI